MSVVQLCAAGAFAHLIPTRDLEPDVTRLWRLADTLSLQEPRDLSLHRLALMEAREKLDRAIALSKEDYHG